MPSDVLVIHIGQFGIQLSSAFWELLCIEHALDLDGEYLPHSERRENARVFFQEVNNGHMMPRSILVDGESSVIDDVRTGIFRNLFSKDSMIYCNEDSACNFARGSFLCGTKCIQPFQNYVRKCVENTDGGLEGIAIINSMAGGSGSGMGALFMQQLFNDYPKSTKMQYTNYPAPVMSMAVVEPYNSMFHSQTTADTGDLTIVFDNEALYQICIGLLGRNSPTFADINRIIAIMITSSIASLRFPCSLNSGIREIRTNLIPYPRVHYVLIKYSPFSTDYKTAYDQLSVDQITRQLFTVTNQSIKCDLNRGKFISMVLNYRGNVTAVDINSSLQKIRKDHDFKFVDWMPTGFKLGVIHQYPSYSPETLVAASDKSVTMMANTTAIKNCWSILNRKFDLLFEKKAFIFWYTNEGVEESEFQECRETAQVLYDDYTEMEMTEDEIEQEYENNEAKSNDNENEETGDMNNDEQYYTTEQYNGEYAEQDNAGQGGFDEQMA